MEGLVPPEDSAQFFGEGHSLAHPPFPTAGPGQHLRLLQALLALGQTALGKALAGKIAQDGDADRRGPELERIEGDLDGHRRAVRAERLAGENAAGALVESGRCDQPPELGHERREGPADHLVEGLIEERQGLRIGPPDLAAGIGHEHGHGGPAEEGLGLRQGSLGPAAGLAGDTGLLLEENRGAQADGDERGEQHALVEDLGRVGAEQSAAGQKLGAGPDDQRQADGDEPELADEPGRGESTEEHPHRAPRRLQEERAEREEAESEGGGQRDAPEEIEMPPGLAAAGQRHERNPGQDSSRQQDGVLEAPE